MNFSLLKEPFPAADLEWRVGRAGKNNGKPWAKVLAYLTNRAIMNRLDEVCGPGNWRNEYHVWMVGTAHGVKAGISIKIGDEWVTKYDGAPATDIEPIKGGFSDSMKRAAVQWGIGRYLYGLDEGWAEFVERGQYSARIDGDWYDWNPPQLPPEFLPAGDYGSGKPPLKAPAKAPAKPAPAAKADTLPTNVDWIGKTQQLLKEYGCKKPADADAIIRWATAESHTVNTYKNDQATAQAVYDAVMAMSANFNPDEVLKHAKEVMNVPF